MDEKLELKSLSSALLISRYILGLGQRGRCCFCAACPNRKMYLEIRSADEGALTHQVKFKIDYKKTDFHQNTLDAV